MTPIGADIRKVDVDNATAPVTFRTGGNRGASIVKVGPMD
jgi:hypothetical protein